MRHDPYAMDESGEGKSSKQNVSDDLGLGEEPSASYQAQVANRNSERVDALEQVAEQRRSIFGYSGDFEEDAPASQTWQRNRFLDQPSSTYSYPALESTYAAKGQRIPPVRMSAVMQQRRLATKDLLPRSKDMATKALRSAVK